MRGIVRVRRGDLVAAERFVARARDLVADRRWDRWRLAPLLAATDLAVERGTVPGLLAFLVEEGLTGDVPALLLADLLLARRGRLRVLDGDVRRGLADLREAGRRLESIGCVNPAIASWRSDAAMALRRLGLHDEALELVEEELRLAMQWGSPRPLAIGLRRRGLLSPGGQGLEDLECSLRLLNGRGMPLEQARTLLALGRVHRLQRRSQQARVIFGEARTLALACGANGVLARVDEELLAAGGRPRLRQEASCAPLTASEDRVARLAVSGRTNDEIARELFVARRTIEVHLTNTYRKLNIRGRAELPAALNAMSR
jgi:DNA-binding CsgD family transcriptional regulator